MVRNLRIFIFSLCNKTNFRTLIRNMTIIFLNSSRKMRKVGIFGSTFKDFYFAPNFAIIQIWERLFQIWHWLFWSLAWKYPNKAFFVLSVSIFKFSMKLCILKNSRLLITKMAIVFFQISAKIPKYLILKLKSFFLFKWNFEWT